VGGFDHSEYEDDVLLERYRSGGENYWLGLLLQRYTLLLLGVGMKYLGDREEAQDAVQQVFLKAITHLPEGPIANFKGWLYVLMRNHCLQLLRERQRRNAHPLPEQPAAGPVDSETKQEEEYTLEQMEQALAQLNPEQKTCVIAFYLHKKSYQQIMEQTGYSFAQVKSYIQNGKRNLKIILQKTGIQR